MVLHIYTGAKLAATDLENKIGGLTEHTYAQLNRIYERVEEESVRIKELEVSVEAIIENH